MGGNRSLGARLAITFSISILCLNVLKYLRQNSRTTMIMMESSEIENILQSSSSAAPDLLLTVPFYVYEDLAWINATFDGRHVGDIARNEGKRGVRFKHGDDYWFLDASLKHPMRTRNIDEAKLFFVPTLLNYIDYKEWHRDSKLCWKNKCNFALLQDAHECLNQSQAFERYPDRHVIVRSFYSAHWDYWNDELSQNPGFRNFLQDFKKMNAIVYEGKDLFPNPGHRITMTKYTVGTPCEHYTDKPFDVAMVASIHDDRLAFEDRRNICKWLSRNTTIKTSVCGYGDRCPALGHSKFGFHAAGDTWGSQRLMDTILSGTVPIFTHLNQYEIAGDWIDWSQLSYYLPVHNDSSHALNVTRHSVRPQATQEIFLQRLQAILNDEQGYERRHKAVLEHIPFFDYTTLHPFDTAMYLFQAQIYPETRHKQSRWSALLLPPPLF